MSGEIVGDVDLFGYEPTVEMSASKWTEAMVMDLLRARYVVTGGNGPRYAYAEHVRSTVGFDAPRIADAVAMSLWGSDDTALHGHEVKVSRADWLTELRDPTKADAFRRYMNYWWLVVSDKAIVRDDLPDGWGLMAPVANGRLRALKPAPYRQAEPLPKDMQASLLRATAKTAMKTLTHDGRALSWTAETLRRQSRERCEPDWNQRAAEVIDTLRQVVR